MSRYLAITNSDRLRELLDCGEIYLSPREIDEISTADPYAADYQELLEANFSFTRADEKVFLLISLLEERDAEDGLDVSVSEIEFLIALNRQGAALLKERYPLLKFGFLSKRMGVIENFVNYIIRRKCAAGIACMRALFGLCRLPVTLNSYNLLDLSGDPRRELVVARHLKLKNIPYHATNFASRTLLTMMSLYRRTLDYPAGDIGYVFDMLEIYHYAAERSDRAAPRADAPWLRNAVYRRLEEICRENPALQLEEIVYRIADLPECKNFLRTLKALSGEEPYILFIYLKAVGIIAAHGLDRSIAARVGALCRDAGERESLASWLGSLFSENHIIPAVYELADAHIFEDSRAETLPGPGDEIIRSFEEYREEPEPAGPAGSGDAAPPAEAARAAPAPAAPSGSASPATPGETAAKPPAPQPPGTELPAANDENGAPAGREGPGESAGGGRVRLTGSDLANISFTSPDGDDFGIGSIMPEGFFDFYLDRPGSAEPAPAEAGAPGFELISLFGGSGEAAAGAFGEPPGVTVCLGQRRPDAYVYAYLDGFVQALTVRPDFSALSTDEIDTAVAAVITAEAPVSKKCVVKRVASICRRTRASFSLTHRYRLLREITHMIEKMRCAVDAEDFIYLPGMQVRARRRPAPRGGGRDAFAPREPRQSAYICKPELIAAIKLIRAGDRLGLGGSVRLTAADVAGFLGLLAPRSPAARRDELARLERIVAEEAAAAAAAASGE